jgi:hypothetical protein
LQTGWGDEAQATDIEVSRLLAQETNVSDLIQFQSDRDPPPWAELVGFVPGGITREALDANQADLLLTSDSQAAVVEVKLGHLMSTKQQEKYEANSTGSPSTT